MNCWERRPDRTTAKTSLLKFNRLSLILNDNQIRDSTLPVMEIRERNRGDFFCAELHPTLNRIYGARSIESLEDINYRLEGLLSPENMPGIHSAVDVLIDHLSRRSRILFVGDFDADGATSSAVGILGLKGMGAGEVEYLVPNRFDHGYGLSPGIVDIAAQKEPDLLITVDNGIANLDGVQAARQHGISVIITDHHLPADQLPDADAIVNPNLAGSTFHSPVMAGVGVIFYLMVALRQRLREAGWFDQRDMPNLAELLDLVALGTVADLVPLDKNNRILVANGLKRINAGRARAGISALLDYCRNSVGQISASDLGFAVAPRLNAAGRLQDMSLGIECLLAEEPEKASRLARELDKLNQERRQIESDMKADALNIVEGMQFPDAHRAGICLYEPHWHQGLVGLIASRIKDRTGKPVVAFAKAEEHELKGSARSIPGLHIRDTLNDIHTRFPDLMMRFGGHAAAAGLSLHPEKYDHFCAAFAEETARRTADCDDAGVILSDGGLGDEELSLDFARLLKSSGPWGQQFPEPVFDDLFEVIEHRVVADVHLKLKVRKLGGTAVLDAIAFYHEQRYESCEFQNGLRLVYKLDVNEYQGRQRPQLIVQHLALS